MSCWTVCYNQRTFINNKLAKKLRTKGIMITIKIKTLKEKETNLPNDDYLLLLGTEY